MTSGEKWILGLLGLGGIGGAVYVLARRGGRSAPAEGAAPKPPALFTPPSSIPPAPAAGAPAGAWYAKDEAEALGAIMESEAGDGTPQERWWIGWAARNRAAARRVSIVRLVCAPWCGPQSERIGGHGVRPFASSQRPHAVTVETARIILAAPQAMDPTHGATAFVEPRLQDQLHAQGRPDHLSYADVRARWISEGQIPIEPLVGRFEFYRGAA